MNYTLKLTNDWEANLTEAHKRRLNEAGNWKRSEAGTGLQKRIKEIYTLSGNAEIVDKIN